MKVIPFGMNAPKLWPALPRSESRPCLPVDLQRPAACNFAANNCADNAIDVADWECGNDFFFALDCASQSFRRTCCPRLFPGRVLRNLAETSDAGRHFGLRENAGEIEAFGFPMVDGFLDFKAIDAANHSIHLPEPELGHHSRTSSAIMRMKLTTCSGSPMNRLRNSGFCVATPTGMYSDGRRAS